MNDVVRSANRRDRLASFVAPRADAIPQARLHSLRVSRLRRWIVWSCAAIAVVVLVGLALRSMRFLPADLRFARVAMQGSRITIESPKLVGYRKDGRPYEVRARVGIQDLSKPDVFELEQLEVRFETSADSAVMLTAANGLYDAKKDRAELTGGARIHDGKRYEMRLESATMDFRANVMTSSRPVTLVLDKAEVSARSVEFSQGERRATFAGSVHTVFHGEDESEGAVSEAGDPTPAER
jgi:lipopolysaccharide export system protein LptC